MWEKLYISTPSISPIISHTILIVKFIALDGVRVDVGVGVGIFQLNYIASTQTLRLQ
jgi:hypothetical protein